MFLVITVQKPEAAEEATEVGVWSLLVAAAPDLAFLILDLPEGVSGLFDPSSQ